MATKKTAKKAPAKKAATKKTAVKKTATKKAAAPAKKAPVKKAVAKKAVKKVVKKTVKKAASEAPAKSAASTPPLTTIVADLDVGWGNVIYLRGEGGPLGWTKGIAMDCADGKWTWSTTDAAEGLEFKFVLNDKTWAKGENMTVAAGSTAVLRPVF
ncbi:hypothetical protein [Cerasicoccus maritimus]|uniref:hypothetical protein n=1 Tax=Cerasicoccus maritimus TaxID=490089 RepID=UPI0028527312|nr:hypothetical protein [Cerasicoccus maritimus]